MAQQSQTQAPHKNLYEVYVKCPKTGTPGWDIKWIYASSRRELESFPNFDCVISVNDGFAGMPTPINWF